MTAGGAKARATGRPELRVVKKESYSDVFSFRTPAGQVRIPGLRPPGWMCARAEVSGAPGLSPREAELVSRLLWRDGRWLAADVLAVEMFGAGSEPRLLGPIVSRARRKLGKSVIESSYGAGYRIAGRFRPELPAVCSRCGSPVVFERREWTCTDCGRSGELPQLEVIDRGVGRKGYEAGTRQGLPWTAEEEAFVLAHLDDMSLSELGDAVDRTASAVRGYLATHGLKKPYVRSGRGDEAKGERRKGD